MSLLINQKSIDLESGWTILQAAEQLGVVIPTLCHRNGLTPFTSCMLCMVQEMGSGKLLPACSALAENGMVIETDNPAVHLARKNALDLLLSEHVGDCQAPCQRGCPADMNIPQMLRQISQGRFRDALITVRQDIALPAVLGRICPAPCEKVCNRGLHDTALEICLLKKFVADVDLASAIPYQPEREKLSGKRIAIIGAGPAGLTAAYYLSQKGHSCTLFDDHSQPGGMLRYGVEETRLDRKVLDREIGQITSHHVQWQLGKKIGRDVSFEHILAEFDAVCLTTGTLNEDQALAFGVGWSGRGIQVSANTFQTETKKIFSGGNAIGPGRMTVRAVAHGKEMARSVDRFLSQPTLAELPKRFYSRLGRLQKSEVQTLVEALPDLLPSGQTIADEEIKQEARRCLHCDCRKLYSCKLRIYSEAYGAEQTRFKGERKKISLSVQHDLVIYEPGKCIKCGLCVRITEKAKEPLGLTFIGRGFDVHIDVPFGESLAAGLKKVAEECALACPTAALSLKNQESQSE